MALPSPARILPSPGPSAAEWDLDPSVVFLNHGSFGACPRVVREAQATWRDQLEAEPVRFLTRELPPLFDATRRELAQFLGAAPEDLVFVNNATAGVNAVVRSLDLQPGDELITTDHDYNACRNVLHEAARRARARVVVVPLPLPLQNAGIVVERILAAVTPRTRLVFIDHVTSPTALVLPVEQIVRELAARGIDCFVDGAHAPGMVPVDLTALGAAYYTGNLHKWICGPKTAGILHVRRDRHDLIQPVIISHGNNVRRPGYSALQDRFDWPGTFDPTSCLGAGVALRWGAGLLPGGWPALMDDNHQLAVRARRILLDRLGGEPACPESMLGSMASVLLPEALQPEGRPVRPDPLQDALLEEFGIEVPIMPWGEPLVRWLRISAQAYNSPAQYDYLAESLGRLRDRAG